MSILLVGLNHRTAPVEIREQIAFSREGVATALMLFRNQFPHSEVAILSTCNRVEMLVATDSDRPTCQDVINFIAQARDLPVNTFRNCLYTLSGEQACRHMFRVASGLDSMVLGENQIVSQVKLAYSQASEQGTTGRVLNRLFHQAFEVGKRVRTETMIGRGRVSVPSVAVEVAQSIFESFADKQTLVIGAGETAQLVCQYLRDADQRKFMVTTRTLANARMLAESCDAQAVPFDQLDECIVQSDIIITAMSCPMPLLTAQRIANLQKQRRGRLLFILDLAVPRNVDPAVDQIEQVHLYDIDALGRIVERHQQQRADQLTLCEAILDEEMASFEEWLESIRLNPLIEQLYRDAHDLKEAELEKLFRRCPDLTEHQRQAVAQLVGRLVGKFMHPCVSSLRRQGSDATPLRMRA